MRTISQLSAPHSPGRIRIFTLSAFAGLAMTIAACGGGGAADSQRGTAVTDDQVVLAGPLNVWAAGNEAISRCRSLPVGYEAGEPVVDTNASTGSVNPWAAGDAAVAQYLNELAERC